MKNNIHKNVETIFTNDDKKIVFDISMDESKPDYWTSEDGKIITVYININPDEYVITDNNKLKIRWVFRACKIYFEHKEEWNIDENADEFINSLEEFIENKCN